VLLPELINGSESNFVGTFAGGGMDPKDVSEGLMAALERVKQHGLQLTYFTACLDESQLQRIEEANLTLGHRGPGSDRPPPRSLICDRGWWLSEHSNVLLLLSDRTPSHTGWRMDESEK
jgi:hypothetical protein